LIADWYSLSMALSYSFCSLVRKGFVVFDSQPGFWHLGGNGFRHQKYDESRLANFMKHGLPLPRVYRQLKLASFAT
jgi:hypothetical protein